MPRDRTPHNLLKKNITSLQITVFNISHSRDNTVASAMLSIFFSDLIFFFFIVCLFEYNQQPEQIEESILDGKNIEFIHPSHTDGFNKH